MPACIGKRFLYSNKIRTSVFDVSPGNSCALLARSRGFSFKTNGTTHAPRSARIRRAKKARKPCEVPASRTLDTLARCARSIAGAPGGTVSTSDGRGTREMRKERTRYTQEGTRRAHDPHTTCTRRAHADARGGNGSSQGAIRVLARYS